MLFNSVEFLIFFPVVVLLYFIIPNKYRYIWLLISSYFFYMCWNAKYALLLLFSTAVTYACGLLINKYRNNKKLKKTFVATSLFLNLGILFTFKYFNFIVDNINRVLSAFHLQLLSPSFDVVLPVGISFYIFQALGYTIDVYRNEVKVERNFLRYALFVSFFPQLVAGPIERSKNLLSQFYEKHVFEFKKVIDGLLLMIYGLFLKIVVADRIAVVVDTIFNNYPTYNGFYIVIGAFLFAFQIYCDFSGYSTIAIGAARVMGFELMNNFKSPYFAKSVSEFWRRWHISLSTWFRDYLYIPLGGNRKGKIRKYLNIMIVFLVSGLWHGASWSFVVWGGLNGLFQVIGDSTKRARDYIVSKLHINRDTTGHRWIQIIATFIMVDFTWIFFRANGIKNAISMVKSIFSVNNLGILFDESLFKLGLARKEFQFMLLSIVFIMIIDYLKYKGFNIMEWFHKQNYLFKCLITILLIIVILIFGRYGSVYDKNNFIYFQF